MPLSGELNCHQTCVNSGSLMSKSSFMPELRRKGVVRSRTILLVSRSSESSGRILPLDLSRKIESNGLCELEMRQESKARNGNL